MSKQPSKTLVPNGNSRRDTAVLLVGTAQEHGLPDSAVFATQQGFYISDTLRDILYSEGMSAINSGVETGPDEQPVSGNEVAAEPEGEFYDPADYKVDEVKATVTETDDIEFAEGVLDAEVEGKNRSSLTEWLTEFIETSGNRAEENNTNTLEGEE